jgi:hypothetical protein
MQKELELRMPCAENSDTEGKGMNCKYADHVYWFGYCTSRKWGNANWRPGKEIEKPQ